MQKLINFFTRKTKASKNKDDETSFTFKDDETSFTFKVDNVKPNRKMKSKCDIAPESILGKRVDQENFRYDDFSHKNDTKTKLLYSSTNGLMAAAHFAYINHCPLRISVSDFILMIGQGIAAHMEIHAEDVRPYFVDHEGKEEIIISRPDFKIEGGNDWSTLFGEFSEEVQKRVKMDFYDIMIDDTSVATKLSKIASEIAIMDTFKHYFEYVVLSGCAMTEITLVGSKDDWEKLRSKVHKLKEFNTNDRLQLDWWLNRLVPVVDQIVDQAVSRKIDKSFWSKIYQYHKEGSYMATPMVNGWLNIFNPYIFKEKNSRIKTPTRSTFENIHPENLMSGVCKAPVLMKDMETGKTHPMTVYGGFLGAKVDKNGTIETEYFYATTFDDWIQNKESKDEWY